MALVLTLSGGVAVISLALGAMGAVLMWLEGD